jgi:hypothetical protein
MMRMVALRMTNVSATKSSFQHGVSGMVLLGALVLAALGLGANRCRADDAIPRDPEPRWWKGNIHTHTLWSDGDDFPEMVAEWYRERDYHFLALSDHNILSEGQRWMSVEAITKRGGDQVIPKYRARFGPHWVETRGDAEAGDAEVRLKPLDEFRALVEERGKFLMIVGEEISDSVSGKPIHMNATNLRDLLQPLGGPTVAMAIRANLRNAEDQAQRLGREIIVHLNHPNFHYAVTAEDLAEAIEERYFEVYNGHPGVAHEGDAEHPSVERIWDVANTLRLLHWQAPPLMGVATDDSHAYHGEQGSTPGRGWIMVRARHLSPESLIRAMKAGDFYASSGVLLDRIEYDQSSKTLHVKVQSDGDAAFTIEFLGTRLPTTKSSLPKNPSQDETLLGESTPLEIPSEAIGTVLARHESREASYTLTGDELYVRACITSSLPHENPSFKNQKQQAWTQPVGWDAHVKP